MRRRSRGAFWRWLSRPGLARRGLGVVYVLAFASLGRQVVGLFGRRGVMPARRYLERVDEQRPPRARRWSWRLRAAPSLLWLDPSDAGLERLAAVGQVAGVALALGAAPRLAAAVAWASYLSFVTVGRPFLPFQWDVLLLEAGLAAMLGRPGRLVLRALAVRLQLESGIAKLASRDPTWRDGSACCYHQQTQPLPTPVGWYAHHLPRRVQRLATALTLAVECGAPLLALGRLRLRRLAFVALAGFQGLIALTGSYGFFNPLTVVLDLALLERAAPRPPRAERLGLAATLDRLAAVALVGLGAVELASRIWPASRTLARLEEATAKLAPFHVTGSYGLFSVMTTSRPEIVIEGSDDGVTWSEYGFRYKPGDVRRPPRWAAPHQPRLDWQMWFAALGDPPDWFIELLIRLLEGAPDVLALLDVNPFPDAPPRLVRAVLYDYEMDALSAPTTSGTWWRRTRMGLYVPACSLRPEPDGKPN
jgi:hypothetical protein